MILPYCIAFMFFILAARSYHCVRQHAGSRPDVWTWPLLFELSNIASTIGGFGLLIGGIFFGEWWWPLAAIGFTIVVGGFVLTRHDKAIVWLTTTGGGACISALIGVVAAGIALLA
jgi:hypothetical protein